MKKAALLIISLLICVLCGCATTSKYNYVDGSGSLSSLDKFEIGEITDKSNFISEENIDIVELMRQALSKKLLENELLGAGYKIDITIVEYRPGNAFQRWLVPGWGQTYLKVDARIVNSDGKEIASIPVERSVAAGGGFTIGAWKSCFNDVATEIVKLIKKEMK